MTLQITDTELKLILQALLDYMEVVKTSMDGSYAEMNRVQDLHDKLTLQMQAEKEQ